MLLQSIFFLWNAKWSFLMLWSVHTALISPSLECWDVLCFCGSFLLIHSVPLCSRCTSQPLIRRHDDAILPLRYAKDLAHPFTDSNLIYQSTEASYSKIYFSFSFPPFFPSPDALQICMCRYWVIYLTLIQEDDPRVYTSTPTTVQSEKRSSAPFFFFHWWACEDL